MGFQAEPALTPSAVRELAADLLPGTPELSARMTDHLIASIDELQRGDDELRAGLLASVESNIGHVLRLLKWMIDVSLFRIPAFTGANVLVGVVRPATFGVLFCTSL